MGSVFTVCGLQELLQRSKRIDLSIRGEGEGVFEEGRKTGQGGAGVPECKGGVWGAVCSLKPSELRRG